MILKIEIEKFIEDIEKKLPKLDGKAYESAKDKINILSRVSIEFMEYEDLMRKLAQDNSKANLRSLKLERELEDLKKEVKHLKENI